MRRIFASLILAPAIVLSSISFAADGGQRLPAQFVHDRIILEVLAPDGRPLRFYTDTGGGPSSISSDAAIAMGMAETDRVSADGGEYRVTNFPDWLERAGIPRPTPDRWPAGRLILLDSARFASVAWEGSLGARWFAERVWAIDYPKQTFHLLPAGSELGKEGKRAELGFRIGEAGKPMVDFPRITIEVDGESFDMLLDTGATAQLTAASGAVHDVPEGTEVAASYITRSVFERWAANHPDWKVTEDADMAYGKTYPMIEVPRVTIAGLEAGPVWFYQRPDPNFRQWMSSMMDRPIEGAIGGSALKYFRVVLDYPASAAYFWLYGDVAAD